MSATTTEPTTVTVDELRTGLTDLLAQVKETGTPLNVAGGFVVLSAAEYARFLDQAERLETLSSVLTSIGQFEQGQYVTLEELDNRIRTKHFGGKA
jgi:PHD/YefM family antitoxin component YafN of YafNO toxin-antitoxin module